MKVTVYFTNKEDPLLHTEVIDTYEEGSFFCVKEAGIIRKYITSSIERIIEDTTEEEILEEEFEEINP